MIIKKTIKLLLSIISVLIRDFILKRKDLVVIQTNSLYRYCDNARYLYEYMHSRNGLTVYWDTESKQIYKNLLSKGYNVLQHNSLKSYLTYLRARVVVGTGSYYPDFLKTVGRKTIKYCLYHGSGPKATIPTYDTISETLKEIYRYLKYDIMNATSEFDAVMRGKLALRFQKSRLVINGYPRCDHLFDKDSVACICNKKKISKSYFKDMDSSSKILLYAPTFRLSNFNLSFPMTMYEDFDMEKLNRFLKDNDMYMLVSNHPLVKRVDITDAARVKFINTKKDPFFDINLLLPEVDMLIGDYSTIHVEFAILDRPQIYLMPDYNQYFWERGFLEDYRQNLAGKEAESFKDLLMIIEGYAKNPSSDSKLRKRLLDKYYDTRIKNSCEKNYLFVKKLMQK